MIEQRLQPALLLLEDGTVFHGTTTGCDGTSWGEICFNTGMTGYQEIFTDPSYFGQILVMASPHIGNYGMHQDESESAQIQIAGLVCRSFSDFASRPSAHSDLKSALNQAGKVAIQGIDTRALVRHLRDHGSMNAILSTETLDLESLRAQLREVPSMDGLELASRVSTREAYELGDPNSPVRIAAIDYGMKRSIAQQWVQRGALVKVFPMNATAAEMEAWNPNAYFLSNGPGDPAAMAENIDQVRSVQVLGKPLFGICLGHQLLALANGLSTVKMHHGHRGINHPVLNLERGQGEITSQNHGFVVTHDSLEAHPEVILTHRHLNDGTIAGIRLKDRPVFSVQYHPEAGPGPRDSRYLFDQFIALISQAV
ncbi:glutamine-hydrolyzing carbamoyl-phosphate synthase small subunit [bacterium]|nr:glutamine-hydrolyzing carbamoyl-phosphate synthase small subunit [bacterium]